MADERQAPDLRTLQGQLDYLNYHAPGSEAILQHNTVNRGVLGLWKEIGHVLPDGPGKTRALHALNRARMEMNNCIANKGA